MAEENDTFALLDKCLYFNRASAFSSAIDQLMFRVKGTILGQPRLRLYHW